MERNTLRGKGYWANFDELSIHQLHISCCCIIELDNLKG